MKQKIYKMILDGYTYGIIMKDFHISERTLYRYLDIIFSEEQDFLEETLGGREEMKGQIRICRDRLLEDRRTLQEWMKDPDFKDKVKAMHLSAEIAAAVLRLYDSGPGLLSKHHAFPRYDSLTEEEELVAPVLAQGLCLRSSNHHKNKKMNTTMS